VKTFWIVVSGLCGIAAVVFIVKQDYDKAFIAAALGAVAWFLCYRVRLREKFRDRDLTDEDEDDQSDEEDDQL
jgi:hypothetical protein